MSFLSLQCYPLLPPWRGQKVPPQWHFLVRNILESAQKIHKNSEFVPKCARKFNKCSYCTAKWCSFFLTHPVYDTNRKLGTIICTFQDALGIQIKLDIKKRKSTFYEYLLSSKLKKNVCNQQGKIYPDNNKDNDKML